MTPQLNSDLLETLKAVADESRLLILRLLNEREYTVGDLASEIKLGEPTVSHHLAKLRKSGLVTLRMSGNQHFYSVHILGLTRFKRLVSEIEKMPVEPAPVVSDNAWIDALGWDAEDAQVLRAHTVNGKITHLPTKNKKLLAVLRWLATLFQPDIIYSEKEINAILKAVYEADYVGLRRDLIDLGYLRRERGGSQYWLTPADEFPISTAE